MRAFGLLVALPVLVHCGPKLPDQDTITTTTADTDPSSTTTTGSGTATTGPLTTGPDTVSTTHATTAPGECGGLEAGHVWTCRCTTVLGPWIPFNEACDKQESGAVEWVEWLCENYADEEQTTTDAGTTGGTTAGARPDSTTTGDDTGSLGCECTCEVVDECCDDSKP
ncbi:hypothetical protein [Nannocystis radixulma]|uniref:Uncharacterized protein n=1 Tax=Nannocystis radixulma TaxID=2995305 RepID=A0ABT5BEJ9_9BACT|nr:hypothetical protein [Nannocystis radixulma]MDC0672575.1 hypothetical protein [Nannocystis radixulma]